jgi:plasmid maintenance system antidote protein VapI
MDTATREYIRREIDKRSRMNIRANRMNRSPLVEVEPFRRILEEFASCEPGGMRLLSSKIGVHETILSRVLRGDQKHISFDLADRIVIGTDGFLRWYQDPCLYDIYLAADFYSFDDPRGIAERKQESRQRANARVAANRKRKRAEQRAEYRRILGRPPSLPLSYKEIASKLGITSAQVSYAINGKKGVSEERRRMILDFIAGLDAA